MSKPLKLMIQSEGDLPVVSSVMQDAAVRVDDLRYDHATKRFILVCNRYMWEAKRWYRRGQRTRAALHFNDIISVQFKGINQSEKSQVLALLAITSAPLNQDSETPETLITLNFAGGAAIQLQAGCCDGLLSDLSHSWDAKRMPSHNAEP